MDDLGFLNVCLHNLISRSIYLADVKSVDRLLRRRWKLALKQR